MSQPPIDIVRELHDAADRAGLVCTKTGNFQAAMIDATYLRVAAAHIQRLRVWEHSAQNAEREIAALRAERDEARRSVCEMSIQLGGVYRRIGGKTVEVTTPEGCAEIMRWDCFKKDTNA